VGDAELVGVGVKAAVAVKVLVGGWGVESSALAGLTLNCRIGQKIRVAINRKIDEDVSKTPRENLVREG
jgi:hypothetical protein